MKNKHPYSCLNQSQQVSMFIVFLPLAILLLICMQIIDQPLQTEAAPMGIVSFQLAGSLSESHLIMESWQKQGQMYAAFSLGLDYLFMLTYAVAFGLACVLLASKLFSKGSRLADFGPILAWGAILAALLDVLGNYTLWQLLIGSDAEIWAIISYWSATIKFTILTVIILYLVVGLILAARPKASSN